MALKEIAIALRQCGTAAEFAPAARDLLGELGYASFRDTADLPADPEAFLRADGGEAPQTKSAVEFVDAASRVDFLFQFTKSEIAAAMQGAAALDSGAGLFDESDDESFLFFAAELRGAEYTRSQYAAFTREINKKFNAPSVVLFRANPKEGAEAARRVTLSFVWRRPSKTDAARDVLGKVSLLREVSCDAPHRGHLDILEQLQLKNRAAWMRTNKKDGFSGLLVAWLDELDTKALNRRFYKELLDWFTAAKKAVTFPGAAGAEQNIPHVIRLLCRMLFIWFMKEKGLVAPELFEEEEAKILLNNYCRQKGGDYYRAVLQNLFFATLNTEIGKRGFSRQDNSSHRDFSFLRYADLLADKKRLREHLNQTPFVNGGLFDCLDSHEGEKQGGYRVDCFTDNPAQRKKLHVPNSLFFGKGGLFPLLKDYKFTVEENTPIEKEAALDPELLGNVFENLAAEINSETAQNARNATGSFYTPRVVVNYMVRESLLAYFCRAMGGGEELREKLRDLLAEETNYDEAANLLNEAEKAQFINAAGSLRVFDPAAGSGAFPMGVLQKMVLALQRLDPQNTLLYKREMKRAKSFEVESIRSEAVALVKRNFSAKNAYNNYGRKLSLVRDCIFGADYLPTAVQICRLRFFISLVIEQETDKMRENFGIQPLPNLETKILAADTLKKLATGPAGTRGLHGDRAKELLAEIAENRRLFFDARERRQKLRYQSKDKTLRGLLAAALAKSGMETKDAGRIADWELFDETKRADWFDPEWMFGVDGGFDLVIGNPPYVQLQKGGGRLANRYAPFNYETFARTGDIYCLFYERGAKLCKPGGQLCYITSNKWMRSAYGEKTRRFVMKNNPRLLVDFGAEIFEAVVDTNILLLQNAKNADALRGLNIAAPAGPLTTDGIAEQMEKDSVLLGAKDLPAEKLWFINKKSEFAVLQKIEETGTPLKQWGVSINRGVTTGYNDAFIIDESTRKGILDACADKAEAARTDALIKPVLRGRDIKRYRAEWANLYLIYSHSGIDLGKYPQISKHLHLHKGALEKKTGESKWHELQVDYYQSGAHKEFGREKIIYPDITKFLPFTLDKNCYMANNGCYILTGDNLAYMVAVLNSRAVHFWIRRRVPDMGSDRVRLLKAFMVSLPVPKITAQNQKTADKIAALAEEISARKAADADADTAAAEGEIDELVYDLYELTDEEKALVKNKAE